MYFHVPGSVQSVETIPESLILDKNMSAVPHKSMIIIRYIYHLMVQLWFLFINLADFIVYGVWSLFVFICVDNTFKHYFQ